jgi:hypothetical protein
LSSSIPVLLIFFIKNLMIKKEEKEEDLPDLEFNFFTINVDCFHFKVNSDC